ncbi:hypothetical protein [Actinocorallia populi]|uniref:hypothetical protein n=1 Tax=Actinocorallia populi TaxID=2079200 RepID=UPI000D090F9A|nr:hypothetical protein [Actinocorallia populi]
MVPEPDVRPGDKVKVTAHVYATGAAAEAGRLKVTADGGTRAAPDCELSAHACDLGDVTTQGRLIPVELSVPAKAAGTLRVTTAVSARTAPAKTVVHLLTVAKKDGATPSPSGPGATSAPSAPASPPSSAPPATTPYSTLPSGIPQTPLSSAPVPESADDPQLPPIVADASPTAQPLTAPQTVAANNPDTANTETLARVQAIWLGVLLALFATLSLQLKRRSLRGAHRRTGRGGFAR